MKTRLFPKLCQDCEGYDAVNDRCKDHPGLTSFKQIKAHILRKAKQAMEMGVPLTEEIVEDGLQRVIIAD